jgi:hypothetical protein
VYDDMLGKLPRDGIRPVRRLRIDHAKDIVRPARAFKAARQTVARIGYQDKDRKGAHWLQQSTIR